MSRAKYTIATQVVYLYANQLIEKLKLLDYNLDRVLMLNR